MARRGGSETGGASLARGRRRHARAHACAHARAQLAGGFRRDLRRAPEAAAGLAAPRTRCYSRRRRAPSAAGLLSHRAADSCPRGVARPCRDRPDLAHIWHRHPGRAAPARSRTRRTTSGSRRCGRSALDGRRARRRGARRASARGSPSRFARRPAGARAAPSSGPSARVEVARRRPTGRSAAAPARAAAQAAGRARARRLNPRLTFEQFVIGDANRFAHAAALAVAEIPGQAYNPLFIYGPPGVGKTHLLHSIGNYVRAYGGGLTVRYTTVEAFTNDFLGALHGGDIEPSRRASAASTSCSSTTSSSSQSKAKTEEEFFHTFNALHDAGSQLVLTSDRLPRDLDALEDRLRERFEAGLVTDIQPPDLATRMTVLRKRVAPRRRRRSPTTASSSSSPTASTDNIRALEGALIRVVAFASLTGRPLDAALAAEVLDGLYPDRRAQAGGRPARPSSHPGGHLRAFDLTRDELALPQPRRAPRLAAPGRHVPRARAHRRDAPRHRRGASAGATTPRSCTRAGAPPSASRPTPRPSTPFGTSPSACDRALEARRRGVSTGMTDRLRGPFTQPVCAVPRNLAGLSGTCAHLHSPYDF